MEAATAATRDEEIDQLLAQGPLSPPAEERAVPVLDAELAREYERLFSTCTIRESWLARVDRIVDALVRERVRYASLETAIGTPWYIPAVIHNMESGLRFDRHLHNGDPLTARTTHVPAGRPPRGTPPFTWVQSAMDALQLKGLHLWDDWDVAGALFKLEQYNGWGYRMFHPEVLSPYLWSGCTHYERGKYVADGRFDPAAVSQQAGAAVLLRRMVERELIPAWAHGAAPPLRYSGNTVLPFGEDLQRFLNTRGLGGEPLQVDGKLGKLSSNAFKVATGYLLAGDPRLAAPGSLGAVDARDGLADAEAACDDASGQVLDLAGQEPVEDGDLGLVTGRIGDFMARGGGWGGAEATVRRAIAIGRRNGLKLTSLKRSWGSVTSDHHQTQQGSLAADLSNGGAPTPEMDRTAGEIAAAVGVPGWKGGVLERFHGGLRLQLIWRWTGHFNHVHVGVRSLDTQTFDESRAPTLRRGDRGIWVWYLQYKLTMLAIGHAEIDPGNADGDFGPRTERALKAFQSQAGLAATGVADRRTWDAMS